MRKSFIYVTGSSGSGANILARVLSRTAAGVGIGETHRTTSHYMIEKIDEAHRLAWDRFTDFGDYERHLKRFEQYLDRFCILPQYVDKTHLIFKRNILDGEKYTTDFASLKKIIPGTKMLVVYRTAMGAAYSSFRRRLGKNLRNCAIIQEEQLCVLAQQVRELSPDDCMVISYESFCANKAIFARPLAKFTGIPEDQLAETIDKEQIDQERVRRWTDKLGPERTEMLVEYFNERKSLWSVLDQRASRPLP